MPKTTPEVKQPDFMGLQLLDDAVGAGAVITRNCDLNKFVQLDKRGGYRRLNQIKYDGGISAIIDVQRICDFQKVLIISGIDFGDAEVFEHEGANAVGGVGGGAAPPFFNPNLGPLAQAQAVPAFGVPPLLVKFNSFGSFDPEGGPLTYFWNFGDGTPINNQQNPQHVYVGNQLFPATMTVRDQEGAEDTAQVPVDTRDVIVAADFGATIQTSPDGGITFQPVVGVPLVGAHAVLGANGFIFAFVNNGPNTDVYRSLDGENFALLSNFVGNTSPVRPPILAHNGRILVPSGIGAAAQTLAIFSDDDGASWATVVVAGGFAVALSICRMSVPGELMGARQNVLGGFPYEFYFSANNGQAWALVVGSFGDSVQAPLVTAGDAGRVIAHGSVALPGLPGQIQTSDDQGTTWQLRQTTVANAAVGVWSSGDEAIVEDNGAANQPWRTVNNGNAWGNFVGWGAVDMHKMIQRPDGFFAATSNGIYFSAALPNFALRGGGGTLWRTIATLRGQET